MVANVDGKTYLLSPEPHYVATTLVLLAFLPATGSEEACIHTWTKNAHHSWNREREKQIGR
jgi:hypothetical protein